MDEILKELNEAIIEGEFGSVSKIVNRALDASIEPSVILKEGMIVAMSEVGKRFEDGEYFVPEMLMAARAMKSGLEILRPHMIRTGVKSAGKVVIASVRGDLHDIGKNLVGMMLEGAGFEIVDMGTDVPTERLIEKLKEEKADILALSALLTTTMPNMKDAIEALKLAGMRENIKVLIGGAPVTEEYARQIGADGFAPDASRAVEAAKSLL